MGRAMFDDITPPSQGHSNAPSAGDIARQAPTPPLSRSSAPITPPKPHTEEPTDTPTMDTTDHSASTTDGGEHHSIRDIAPPVTKDRESRRARRAERRQLDAPGGMPPKKSGSSVGKFGMWAIAVVVLAIALSAIGFVFIGKTTITVVPLQESITLSANVVHTAYREPENGELGYRVVSHSLEATENIPATGRETVEEKAAGSIVVYNNHSSAPQRLIKNTRFEGPNGEIYRVRNSFVVPGMDGDTPGSIEVVVHADKAGADQNISALGTRFTIPGLKGDPRFDTFHAELSEAITGGFVGERAIVDEGTLTATRTQLQTQLRAQATQALMDTLDDTTVVFEPGIFVTFDSLPTEYADDDSARVREVAQIRAVGFDEHALARMLATAALASTEDGNITIDDTSALTFNIIDGEVIDITTEPLVQFTLAGQTGLTWEVDTEALKADLVGKDSGALNTVMSGYPGIKSAQATIRPFWKSDFPSENNSITVELLRTE